jgi:hypothetical protein
MVMGSTPLLCVFGAAALARPDAVQNECGAYQQDVGERPERFQLLAAGDGR